MWPGLHVLQELPCDPMARRFSLAGKYPGCDVDVVCAMRLGKPGSAYCNLRTCCRGNGRGALRTLLLCRSTSLIGP